ncbi:protein of unknown function (plasmid) [Cupriavidus taiwanensis]|uniref:Uncharacterized protein n=1 Tax=Cupriavidus taiwanensis TaxID=164546 RepID=A0A7Z7JEH8_9BURK|nr:protein of unknown function [Cupriavidus taiwanensis]SOZ11698.1 protein of unknown function [Cupriavidus taiwanensis]SOZ43053.1 protein of unknown function [Cupriavidus taiwanensis]SPC22299.1 protein of unknown function [Cupriavidus taiwanensis]SPD53803.1 protein of unknown function [Cupriavidus taiwanensis]
MALCDPAILRPCIEGLASLRRLSTRELFEGIHLDAACPGLILWKTGLVLSTFCYLLQKISR